MSEKTYTFRLKFRFEDMHCINSMSNSLYLGEILGQPVSLISPNNLITNAEEPIKDSKWLLIRGNDYDSEDAAYNAGNVVMDALRWYALNAQCGVSIGDGLRSGGFTEAGFQLLREQKKIPDDIILENDIHGLTIWPTQKTINFVNQNLTVKVEARSDIFTDTLHEHINRKNVLSDEIRLAIDLFSSARIITGLSDFGREPISYPRLALLWSSIEALFPLFKDEKQPENVIIYLNQLISDCDNTDLEPEAKQYIKNGIGKLKNTKIKQKIEKLITTYLDDVSTLNTVYEAYTMRSNIVHGTKIQQSEIRNICNRFEPILVKLIKAIIISS